MNAYFLGRLLPEIESTTEIKVCNEKEVDETLSNNGR
jgi:hypothetical protein